MSQFFFQGVDREALDRAPMLRFERRGLQSRWATSALGVDLASPVHWTPSTQGMLDMCLAGLGWAMTPLPLAQPHLVAGRLVELPPHCRLAVKLYWQRTRLAARLLDRLTLAVRSSAEAALGSPA